MIELGHALPGLRDRVRRDLRRRGLPRAKVLATVVRLLETTDEVEVVGVCDDLCVPDPEPRVSTAHLQIEHSATGWFAQDISRNGTWLRDRGTGEERQLPHISRVMLPRSGELCLGRPFADDPKRLYTVSFDATDA